MNSFFYSSNGMEKPECLICGEKDSVLYLSVRNRFNPAETFSIVQCPGCKFRYLSPRPTIENIEKYYNDEGYQPHKTESRSFKEKLYTFVRKYNNKYKKRVLFQLNSKGTILDYGCGTGEFLEEMKNSGWRVLGIEPSEKARNYTQAKNITMLRSINDYEGFLDVVTMWHVLEHVHDPVALFNDVYNKLKKDGLFIIAVPNPQSIDAKYYKENWVAYDAPRHLYHFTPKDMIHLLDSYRFSVIRMKLLFPDFLYNILLSYQLEQTLSVKSFFPRILKMLLTTLAAAPFNLVTTNRSSSIIYIAKKN